MSHPFAHPQSAPTTLVELLQIRARRQPDQIAYTYLVDGEINEVTLTYGQIDRQARALAAQLQGMGLGSGRALLLYPPGLDFITAFFGCLYAGMVAIPTYPPKRNRPDQRLQAIVADAQAAVALTTTGVLSDLESQLAYTPALKSLPWLATDQVDETVAASWQPPVLEPQTLAFLQYTSGSTGTPKGVMVSHGNILANEAMIQQAFGHTERASVLGWLPVFHDMGLVGNVLQPLYVGIPCILMSPLAFLQKPVRWLQALTRYGATTSGGPNFAYDLCVQKITQEQRAGLDLSRWTVAFNGAEPVRAKTLEQFAAAFEPFGFRRSAFYPCYGMAETTLFVTGGLPTAPPVITHVQRTALEAGRIVPTASQRLNTPEQGGAHGHQESRALVSSGQPWLAEQVVIVDPETATPCPPDQVGEIWVSGAHVAHGYWQQPEATHATFQATLAHDQTKPFLRTGDLGFLQNGQLFVTGRHKDLIILRGRNHYPQDIELTVEESHPALHRGCGAAFAVEVDGTERLVVVQEIERTHLRNLNPPAVFKAIRQAVAEQHELALDTIVLLKTMSMPKTSSGKLQRRACRALFLAGDLDEVARDPQPATTANRRAVDTTTPLPLPVTAAAAVKPGMEFSLMYFSSQEAEFTTDKYKLFIEGARWADAHDFTAIWTPERHFHAFGGLYPNPSVLSAALAMVTQRIRLRAGSVVLPLHHPVRVVEEWAIVDNLSQGRVDLALAQGWNPNDFVLAPANYANRTELMLSGIETLRKLWRGESLPFPNGEGKETMVRVYPLPHQPEPTLWLTCSGGVQRFIDAGAAGVNILTALLFQSVEELAEKLTAYRTARANHGHDPAAGHVTLMLHTFVADDMDFVRTTVRPPLIDYLKSSVNLWRNGSKSLDDLTPAEQETLLTYAFERYFRQSGLFGTPTTCLPLVQQLHQIGVSEIACLCDFIPDADVVLTHLPALDHLRRLANPAPPNESAPADEITVACQPTPTLQVNGARHVANTSLPAAPVLATPVQPTPNALPLDERALLRQVQRYLRNCIAATLGRAVDEIAGTRDFRSLGVDSLKAIELMSGLSERVGVTLSPTILFESPTIDELAQYFVREQGPLWQQHLQHSAAAPAAPAPTTSITVSQSQEVATTPAATTHTVSNESIKNQKSKIKNYGEGDLAIIGLACRFPQAATLDEFWQLLSEGRTAIQEVPADRWPAEAYFDATGQDGQKTYSRWGGFLDDLAQFDPHFFGISPREARLMDPQQRIFLQVAWQTLQHAGYAPQAIPQTGVFVGCSNTTYYARIREQLTADDASAGVGNQNAIIANRVSYLFNFSGPSLVVDTMCSSSLVALHLARQSLLRGECQTALVGGVNALLSPDYYAAMSRMKAHAPDGRCKTFDQQADGIVFGEGAGAVLLKPLAAAQADGDTIYAVIKGSAINHGGRANGLTAPNPRAQADLVVAALTEANVTADTISYIEAHGTGTELGDPIEIEGLTQAFRRQLSAPIRAGAHSTQSAPIRAGAHSIQNAPAKTADRHFCAIGSVKTNIGHLEPAAGIAGLIKVVLSMQHGALPPSLNFSQPNPLIAFADSPFYVNTQLTPWLATNGPRRAGLSSFGIGGSNAHIIIEEADPTPRAASQPVPDDQVHLLTLSAKTANGLQQMTSDYAHFLAQTPASLADLCFTSNVSRTTLPHRLTLLAHNKTELQAQLTAVATGQKGATIYDSLLPTETPRLAFLFTGQGAQAPYMGRQLYATQPVFRATLQQCDDLLHPHLHRSLLEIIYPTNPEAAALIHETIYAQPALFALEYALAQMWAAWGIVPDAVLGHSVGELAAACVAGVFDLADGLRFVAERARLMQDLPRNGLMAAVFGEPQAIAALVAPQAALVAIAAVNGPRSFVLSGEQGAVKALLQQAEQQGMEYRLLQTSHAFHSPLLDPIMDEMVSLGQILPQRAPRLPLIAGLYGQPFAVGDAPDAHYWANQMRGTVQFATAMDYLLQQGYTHFLEVGPTPTLISMGKRCATEQTTVHGALTWLPSLKNDKADWVVLLQTVSQLYRQGFPLNWNALHAGQPRQRVALPPYPFEQRRFWADLPVVVTTQPTNDAAPGVQQNTPDHQALPKEITMPEQTHPQPAPAMSQRLYIQQELRQLMAGLLEADVSEVNIHQPFLEMGADSLLLVNAIHKIEARFGVRIKVRQLFDEIPTLDAAVAYIDAQVTLVLPVAEEPAPTTLLPSGTAIPAVVQPTVAPPLPVQPIPAAANAVTAIVAQQLQIMQQQLALLGGQPQPVVTPPAPVHGQPSSPIIANGQPGTTNGMAPQQNGATDYHNGVYTNGVHTNGNAPTAQPTQPLGTKGAGPLLPIRAKDTLTGMNEAQRAYLAAFTAHYTQKTARSKALTQTHRPVLADNRVSAGFRPSLKEIFYPLLATGGQGCRIWDVDDNAYIDICMGFGVNLFGHNPAFIVEALAAQLQEGWVLGPQSPLAGEVAQLFQELTGMERVTFCNSGTEAVMAAVRLARAKTGRNKIALFNGSYHGTFDGVLATADPHDPLHGWPVAPGILPNLVKDVLVLEYDQPQSLEVLRRHAHEIAAVLVEPVQSRRPDLQPRAFLHELRQLTQASGVALIFDEMITGFRIHPGGAQAYFGIEADLATYGKVVGGGLPIGVVAGKADYMDMIDGGMWRYGDGSYPAAETTFFAGTFCKHPLAMAAAHAVLTRLKSEGPALQNALNERTARLAETLNRYFAQEELPLSVVHFGSLFRFAFRQNLDLLFYHLLAKGVYVWEGRNFFLSTAHTDEDVETVVQAVQESINELRAGGFLPPRPPQIPPPTNGVYSAESAFKNGQPPVRPVTKPVAPASQPASLVTIPLTVAQQQLWVLDQINRDGSAAYNESLLVKLTGALAVDAIHAAIQQVVVRHEALRTVFDPTGECQHILPTLDLPVVQVDFTSLAPEEQSAAVEQWLTEQSSQPFDLAQGPLLRAALLKLAADQHLLLLTVHHIVADGMSVGILLQEICRIYAALAGNHTQNRTDALPAPVPFSDYICRQLAARHSPVMAEHAAYWRQQFVEEPPLLELPADHPRPAVMRYQGRRQSYRLNAALTEQLKNFSKQQRTTPFMMLLAHYTLLLHRLSQQDDLMVGFPVSGRGEGEMETLVGYCTHMAPLRSRLTGNPTCAAYVKQIREQLLDVYEHQEYPFAWLLEDLKAARTQRANAGGQAAGGQTAGTSLITAGFNLEVLPALPHLPNLQVAQVPMPASHAKFSMNLNVTETGAELTLDFDYNSDLFTAATIDRWYDHFVTLLTNSMADPAQPVRDLALLSTQARQQILSTWNQTEQAYPQDLSLVALFAQQVARTPDKIAVVCEGEAYTYQELDQRANQLAHYLRSLEGGRFVGADHYVGLAVERGLEMLVGLWGILKTGAAYLPLDPDYPHDRLAYMITHSGAKLIVTHSALAARLPQSDAQLIQLDADGPQIAACATTPPLLAGTPQDLAYMIYTSGSTGKPKGVQIEQRAVVNFLSSMAKQPGITAQDYLLAVTTLSFDIAVLELFLPLLNGATVEIVTREVARDGFALRAKVDAAPTTIMQATPATWRMLLTADWSGKPGLKILCGGEALPRVLADQLLTCGAALWNMYGPTETTVWSTTCEIKAEQPITVGRPIANTQIYILDEKLAPMPMGLPGHLYIGGAGVARGYWQQPELTAERFVADPFRPDAAARMYNTGDLALWRADGQIEFLGRNDHQVKIRGFRIELEEIEAALLQYAGVQEAVVMAQETPAQQKQLVAYVVPRQAQTEKTHEQAMQFSLFYFAADTGRDGTGDSYALYREGAKFADTHGFTAIWTPERHFHAVGGQYPNPALLSASLATITERVHLRAGSVVLPIQHPLRVAEEWAVVDNLSNGRVGVSFTSGWHPVDFAFYPDNFANRKELLVEQMQQVQALWRGEAVTVRDGVGKTTQVQVFPRPVQATLPFWLTCAGNPATFEQAGKLGANLLTHLLSQSLDEVAEKIALYRRARAEAGYDPATGHVTVMIHTFVWADATQAVERARAPFCHYLRSHVDLLRTMAQSLELAVDLNSETDLENLVQFAFERYVRTASLIGSPESCQATVQRLQAMGVNEIACLVDFGIDETAVLAGLTHLDALRQMNQPQTTLALPDLRRFLQAKLPAYMTPAHYVVLDELPLTPNRKVDRRALPLPDFAENAPAQAVMHDTPPQNNAPITVGLNDAETTLTRIWSEVLGRQPIDRQANFFELGGDSILSIQIIRKANEAGLSITPAQLFQHPTLAQLALATQQVTGRQPTALDSPQRAVTGLVPLTPIQRWFWEQAIVEPQHYNQAVLLAAQQPLDLNQLEAALQALVAHHDALRLRFTSTDRGWQQVNAPVSNLVNRVHKLTTLVDLTAYTDEEQAVQQRTAADQAQASLDLAAGPLVRAVIFRRGAGQPDQLLLVIHHLAVDGVSWRILFEDLETVYGQVQAGRLPALPRKTTSFQRWAQKIEAYAQSPALLQQVPHWLEQYGNFTLPVDRPDARAANTEASTHTLRVSLTVAETEQLLGVAPKQARATINELLLTALGRMFQSQIGATALQLDVEGHGREALFADVDVSRTVGWFTTLFPVYLKLADTSDLDAALGTVKEQLRAIPQQGIGWGALRYLSSVAPDLAKLPAPAILFNYLGQFDQPFAQSTLWRPLQGETGHAQSPRSQRSHLLEINGLVVGRTLHLDWTYSENLYEAATIARWAASYIEQLRLIIAHCLDTAGHYTVADFPLADLQPAQLQHLAKLIARSDQTRED